MINTLKIKKSTYFLLIALIALIVIATYIPLPEQKPIGGDTDEHGCLIAAGYSWNKTDKLCVREFEKKYCTELSRNIPVCMQLYDPVCGYPKGKTYSNSCFACSDSETIFYFPGNCSLQTPV